MLCDKCEEFWRAVERKILDAGTLSVSKGHVRFSWPNHSTILHQSLAELGQSAEKRCHICLVLSHTSNQGENNELLSQKAGVYMLLDIEARFGGRSALLSGKFYPGEDTERKGKPLYTRPVGVCEGLLEDEDLRAVLERCSRLEFRSTGSTAAVELASFWLKRCLSTHKKCSNTTRSANFLPTRLLDVGSDRVKLVETTKDAAPAGDREYFALSHCWGTSQIITTNSSNLQNHLKDIPFEKLSKTFQEAVLTTRSLSYRYLWIDSLCIIQGDRDDWEREAAQMCDVYHNATMTIAAAHASGGAMGCFYETDNLLRLPVVVTLNLEKGIAPQSAAFQGWDRRQLVEIRDYEGPPLFDRAWVLQEQLLSTRLLNFDGPMLRWNCLQDEGSTQSLTNDESATAPFYEAIRNAFTGQRDFFVNPDSTRNWYDAVQEYTHRGMTVASDRLVALAGIANAIARTTEFEYLSGLWTGNLHEGLLWYIAHADVQATTSAVRITNTPRHHSVRHKTHLAPSWSWASVTAPVTYPPLGPLPSIGAYHPLCAITANRQKTTLTIHNAPTRLAHLNSIYPETIPDARAAAPAMVAWNVLSTTHHHHHHHRPYHFTFANRTFLTTTFFLFSPRAPTPQTEWQFMHGEWCPDELLDPATPITFVAIGQRLDPLDDSITVYTLGLVPTTGGEGEYRRVGYATWAYCAWYGYVCGEEAKAYERDVFGEWPEWVEGRRGRPAVAPCGDGRGRHAHGVGGGERPGLGAYQGDVGVGVATLRVV